MVVVLSLADLGEGWCLGWILGCRFLVGARWFVYLVLQKRLLRQLLLFSGDGGGVGILACCGHGGGEVLGGGGMYLLK